MKGFEVMSRVAKLLVMMVLVAAVGAGLVMMRRDAPWYPAAWAFVELALVLLTAAIIANLVRFCARAKDRQA